MTPLPALNSLGADCWNRIGIRGDHSCPELTQWVHCHNCPVFAAAGRRFLDAPSPEGYLDEWTGRLAAPTEEAAADLLSVLLFRIGEEWLALPVRVLVEVTGLRPVRRVPHRGGVLAGLVNIRGELHLCVRLAQLLGVPSDADLSGTPAADGQLPQAAAKGRLLVINRDGDRWVFPVDEVDRVHRFPSQELAGVPATVARSVVRLTRAVIHWRDRSIGLLDEDRLLAALRVKFP
jgi:chemotaxis-related protein WspD